MSSSCDHHGGRSSKRRRFTAADGSDPPPPPRGAPPPPNPIPKQLRPCVDAAGLHGDSAGLYPCAPMTFFYGGRVHVFEGVSRDQAQALALLLSEHATIYSPNHIDGRQGHDVRMKRTSDGQATAAMRQVERAGNHELLVKGVPEGGTNAEYGGLGEGGGNGSANYRGLGKLGGIREAIRRGGSDESGAAVAAAAEGGGGGGGEGKMKKKRAGSPDYEGMGHVRYDVPLLAACRRASLARFLKARCQ